MPDHAEPTLGSLPVWGMNNRFDENGNLTFTGKKVRRIRLSTRRAE
jgi:hypothetical protein